MPEFVRIRKHIDAVLFGWIFLSSFFVYLLTLCPTVYWRDSAEFVDAAFALAIPHPAGFPSYMPPANLLTYLPFGPIAFKVNLFSALMGAGDRLENGPVRHRSDGLGGDLTIQFLPHLVRRKGAAAVAGAGDPRVSP